MNELFGARDLSAYQANLEGFTNAVTREATDQAKLNKSVDDYNGELTGITDPVGLIVGGKPIETLVKKGLKKTLGKTIDAIGDRVQQAVNERGIGDLKEIVRNKGGGYDLAGRTKTPRPTTQGEGDPDAPAPTSASEAGSSVERPPAPSGEPEPTLGEAAKDPEVFANAIEKYQPELHSSGPDTVEMFRGQVNTNPVLQEAHDLPISKLGAPETSKAVTSDGATESPLSSGAGATVEEDGTDALGQQIADQGGKLVAKLASKVVGKEGAQVGTDAVLDGVGAAADIAAGSEGGLNPVADVVAGAIGLATLLGGIFGERKAKEAAAPQFIVSSQFGT